MNKKKFVEAIAFLMIIICVLTAFVRVTVNSGDYRNFQWIRGFYAERENSLDAVFVGASSVYAFWCAPVAWGNYGIAVYPFANSNQPIDAAEYIIRESRKTQPDALYIVSVNNVFYEYSEPQIHYLLDFFPDTKEKFQMAEILLDKGEYEQEERKEFYFPLLRYHSRWNELTEADFTYDLDGLKGGSTYSTYLNGIADVTANYRLSEKFAELDERFEAALKSLMDYCEQENVRVLFVTEPLTDENEFTIAKYNTINAMIEKRGFQTLDLTKVFDETGLDPAKDYYDKRHVNIHGSVKTTAYLSEYLIENYGFADKRGNPEYRDWDSAFSDYVEVIAPFAVDFEYADLQHRDYTLHAPELTKLTANGGDQITLTWKAVKGADGYGIFRNGGGGGTASGGSGLRLWTPASCPIRIQAVLLCNSILIQSFHIAQKRMWPGGDSSMSRACPLWMC